MPNPQKKQRRSLCRLWSIPSEADLIGLHQYFKGTVIADEQTASTWELNILLVLYSYVTKATKERTIYNNNFQSWEILLSNKFSTYSN